MLDVYAASVGTATRGGGAGTFRSGIGSAANSR